jgi:hypothetical protein
MYVMIVKFCGAYSLRACMCGCVWMCVYACALIGQVRCWNLPGSLRGTTRSILSSIRDLKRNLEENQPTFTTALKVSLPLYREAW